MTTSREVLTWAASQIGVKENPAGSNHIKYWDYYRERCGVNYQGQPWCACFTANGYSICDVWAFNKDEGRFRYCPSIVNWAKANGQWRTREQGGIPGDLIIFANKGTACHVGFVEKVISGTKYQTIEGNTSVTSNDNGGAVMRRSREIGTVGSSWYILGFVHIPWSGSTSEAPKPGMKTYEEVAKEVIAGKWGNNPERREKLASAGYDATKVQSLVNVLLDVKTPAPATPANGTYSTGRYQIQVSTYLRVRTGASINYRAKTKSEVTQDAQNHWFRNGLANATRVDVSEVKTVGNEVWGKIPSGWICIKQGESTFAKCI